MNYRHLYQSRPKYVGECLKRAWNIIECPLRLLQAGPRAGRERGREGGREGGRERERDERQGEGEGGLRGRLEIGQG
jgi:hypothetical protein